MHPDLAAFAQGKIYTKTQGGHQGWADWAQQATELHTYRTDQENKRNKGQRFYKLNEDNIATIWEDLVKD